MCSALVGRKTPFSGRGSRNAAEDTRPNILQLNTEGLTANKISVIELAYKNKAPVGDPLQNCRQTSDSQLFASWVSPEQEPRPCHFCPRAFGMVTGRSVSRTIRDWVVVHRRCRIQDHQRLQTSTFAIHTNGHPDIPIPPSVCWWLQVLTCQLGLQQNISWRWQPELLGNIQQPWTAAWSKGNTQFLLSPMERRPQSGPGLRESRPGQTCPRKVPAFITSDLPHNATKTQRLLPTAIRWSVVTSARLIGSLLLSHRWIRWDMPP